MHGAWAAAEGAIVGAAIAFPLGVVVLATKRWRNVRRMSAGLAPYRDEVRVTPVLPCAIVGAIVGAIVALRGGGAAAVAAGAAIVPFVLFTQLAVLAALWTARN